MTRLTWGFHHHLSIIIPVGIDNCVTILYIYSVYLNSSSNKTFNIEVILEDDLYSEFKQGHGTTLTK